MNRAVRWVDGSFSLFVVGAAGEGVKAGLEGEDGGPERLRGEKAVKCCFCLSPQTPA